MASGADPKPTDTQKNNLTEAETLLFNLNALYKKFTEFRDYYTKCIEKNTGIISPAGIDKFNSYLQSIVGTLINNSQANTAATIKNALEALAVLLIAKNTNYDSISQVLTIFQSLLDTIDNDTTPTNFLQTINIRKLKL